jgi:hypothetical protein
LVFYHPAAPRNVDPEKLAAAAPRRFSLFSLQPSFIQYLAVFFFGRPTLFRQGQAIFTPGACAAAIRISGPEAVRIAFEALNGPNEVGYIRHGGAFGCIFSFFEAPIRKSRIRSLRFHSNFCGPGRPAATPSFQIDNIAWISRVLDMADLSRNVHRRRASILWGKIPDWGISPGNRTDGGEDGVGLVKERLFFPEIDVD